MRCAGDRCEAGDVEVAGRVDADDAVSPLTSCGAEAALVVEVDAGIG
jgi:hypothetical protein